MLTLSQFQIREGITMDFQLNEEQKILVDLADRMGREEFAPKAARWDRNHEYPHENVEALRRAGLLGMTIPKKFGGPERPLIDVVLVIEQIAKYCGVTARIVVETNMGALGSVMAYGSEAQQRELLVAYQRSIYTALREVSDALVSFDRLREQRTQQERLVQTLEETVRLSDLRYRGGLDSYLQVLDAQRNLFNGQLALAQLRLQERVSVVQLYRALGGGWS